MRNPHNSDPAYLFYKKEAELVVKEIEHLKEEISKTEASIEKALPQTGQKRDLLEALFEQKNKLSKNLEKKDFVDQKIKELIKETQKKYKEAYEKKLPWPDPSEEASFKLQRELESYRNKEWNTQKRIKKYLRSNEIPTTTESH